MAYDNNQGNQQAQKKRREPDVLDDYRLRLYSQPLQEGAFKPFARLKRMGENTIGFEVDYGIKSDKGYKVSLETEMSPKSIITLMNLLIRVASYKGGVSFEMENWGKPWMWDNNLRKNVKSKENMVISRTQVAKRDDGVVTIAWAAKNKQTIEFEFYSDDLHPILQNGQRVAVDLDSAQAAISWAELVKDVCSTHFIDTWEEPEYQKKKRLERIEASRGQQRNGQGGGQRPNQGSSGGYQGGNGQQRPQQPSNQGNFGDVDSGDSFDEEIPF